MEDIRKIISTENVKSHYQGVLPYFEYGADAPIVKYVGGADDNGNFGGFVCDFGKVCTCLCGETITYKHSEICTSGITEGDNSIEARLRYCDILSWYNFIQEQLRDGIYGISTSRDIITDVSVDCSENAYGCEENESAITSETINCVLVDDSVGDGKYSFVPLNIDLFKQIDINFYTLLPQEELQDIATAEEIEYTESVLQNEGTLIVLVQNYDTCMKYDSMWTTWWEKWFGQDWTNLFADYEEHQNFQFCQDFEKYCLGKVNVPETIEIDGEIVDITGILVPESVTYTEVDNLIDWFSTNDIPEKSKELQKAWDDRGGNAFYAFLNSIVRYWTLPTEQEELSSEVSCYLDYLTPYISIPININNKHEYEGTYENYLDDYQPFSAVGIYSGYSEFETSHFVTLEDSGKVESQLDRFKDEQATIVQDTKGVWVEFSGYTGCSPIFRCVMQSGSSVTCGETHTTYIIYTDGHQETVTSEEDNALNVNEEPPVTITSPDRIFISTKKLSCNVVENEFDEVSEEEMNNGISAITHATKYIGYDYVWWECTRLTADEAEDFDCGDGEDIEPNTNDKYRNLFILSCIDNVISGCECGDEFYFLPKFDNGIISDGTAGSPITGIGVTCFDIPFKENTFINMTVIDNIDGEDVYIGDYIPPGGVEILDNTCTFSYVIGGRATYDQETKQFTEIPNTGIRYNEKCFITQDVKGYADFDEFLDVEYFYNSLIRDELKTLVYSDEYRMYRYANQADLVGMEVGTIWTEDNAIIAKLFTKESSNRFLYTPAVKPNVLLERGSASAFESYFKLAECNTFEDLQNYGNNYFNL